MKTDDIILAMSRIESLLKPIAESPNASSETRHALNNARQIALSLQLTLALETDEPSESDEPPEPSTKDHDYHEDIRRKQDRKSVV